MGWKKEEGTDEMSYLVVQIKMEEFTISIGLRMIKSLSLPMAVRLL